MVILPLSDRFQETIELSTTVCIIKIFKISVARSLELKGAGTNHNMLTAYRIMRVVRKTATGWNGQTPIWESIM